MYFRLKKFLKKTPLADIYIYLKYLFVKPDAQNDETQIIRRLLQRFKVPHRDFS